MTGRAAEVKPSKASRWVKIVRLASRQPSRSQKGRQAGSVRWPAATRADSWNAKPSHQ